MTGSRSMLSVWALGVALALSALLSSAALATTITITTTADPALGVDDGGHCTLREALHAATKNLISGSCPAGQAAPAVDTIAFAIPDGDSGCTGSPKLCTIKPGSTFDDPIDDPVIIDGYTQPNSHANTLAVGDDAVILIELDGTNLNPMLLLDGRFTSLSGVTIRGLAFTHVTFNSAIRAMSVDNLTVTGNFIGTNASGTAASGGAPYGIYADSGDGAVIGGTVPADRNVLAGVTTVIFLEGTSNSARETNCAVQGNYIAVDRTGTVPLPVTYGVQLRGTTNCTVGGSAAGAGNVIGLAQQGISVDVEFLNGQPSNTTIQGNLIGTDATGTVALAQSSSFGIEVGSSDGTVIGGSAAGESNLISGNGDGIYLANTPTNVLVAGNKIGTDITGKLPLGNGACGIEVNAANTTSTIGGTAAGAGNVIAFNGTNGIGIGSIGANNTWAIEGNSIHDNGSLGISLNGRCSDLSSAPLLNDLNDADTGPNGLQNYPVIATTITSKTIAHVSGTLNSTADTTFRVEFFANAGCDPNGHGEGKFFIGSADVTTIGNNSSFGPFDMTVPGCRHVITATATDPAGNTSEFSACSDQSQDSMFTECFDGD